MSEENVLETKLCRACNQVKSIKSFNKNGLKRLARCKQCILEGNLIPRSDNYLKSKESTHLRLFNPTTQDFVETYQLLEKMGYNIKGDIHQQFCEKFNLPVIEPRNIFNNYISAENCFDF